jgi:hypothetical protein
MSHKQENFYLSELLGAVTEVTSFEDIQPQSSNYSGLFIKYGNLYCKTKEGVYHFDFFSKEQDIKFNEYIQSGEFVFKDNDVYKVISLKYIPYCYYKFLLHVDDSNKIILDHHKIEISAAINTMERVLEKFCEQ